MVKYTIGDIKSGKRTLSNGSIAGYVDKNAKKWRIVNSKGVEKEYLKNINKTPISEERAQKSFDRYYNNVDNFASDRGRKQSRTYDMNHTSKKTSNTSAYTRNPRKYDYPGVDTGKNTRKALSDLQIQNIQKLMVWQEAVRNARKKQNGMLKKGTKLYKVALEQYKLLTKSGYTPQILIQPSKESIAACHTLRKNRSACKERSDCKIRQATGMCVKR